MKILKFLFCFMLLSALSSCYKDTDGSNKLSNLTLIADSSEKIIGEQITFKVSTDSGEDLTALATFFVNEVQLNSNAFSSTSISDYVVKAKIDNVLSNEITVSFKNNIERFTKHVLIEDYTGTWCGNCPRVSYGIERVKAITNKAVAIAIHRGETTTNFDPYNINVLPLENFIQLAGYPTAKLNRTTTWTTPHTNPNQAVNLTLGENIKLGLALNTINVGNAINLDVKTKFAADFSNLRLVVCILENNLIYNQTNYTSYFGASNPIINFDHDHVLRAYFTDLFGDTISNSETLNGKIYSRNFSIAMPANITNNANIEFVAFVVDSNNKVINVRSAGLNENQTFEENQ
jgi:Outer membrane protein Omp28